jgi:probable rRNA maturation factor
MGKYNRKYFKRGGTTDVISFDLSDDEEGALSAQVIVCGQVAARESANRGLSQQREVMLYVVHGLLHLLGYDDAEAADAAEMYLRQEDLLDEFLTVYRRSLTRKRKRKRK